jgi:hypothetical protein
MIRISNDKVRTTITSSHANTLAHPLWMTQPRRARIRKVLN